MDMSYGEKREVMIIVTAKDAVTNDPQTVDTCQVALVPPNRKPNGIVNWIPVPGFSGNSGTFVIAAPGSDAVDPLITITTSTGLWVRTGVGDDEVPIYVERINYS